MGQTGRMYRGAAITITAKCTKSVYAGSLDNAKVDSPAAEHPFRLSTLLETSSMEISAFPKPRTKKHFTWPLVANLALNAGYGP